MGVEKVCAILFGAYLLFLAIKDAKERKLSLALLFIAAAWFLPLGLLWKVGLVWRIAGAGVGALLCGISYISKEGIGWADSVLVLLVGVSLGFDGVLFVLAVALALVMVTAGILFLLKKVGRKDLLPFVPFLFLGYCAYCAVGLWR